MAYDTYIDNLVVTEAEAGATPVTAGIYSEKTRGIVRATKDSSSTSTNFILTAEGITELYDGLLIFFKNNTTASASGVKFNLNNLGAKAVWSGDRNTAVTTHIRANGEYLFHFDSLNDRWVMQTGYFVDNTNTIGEYSGAVIIDENTEANGGRYTLLMQTQLEPARYSSIVKQSGSTSTSKTKASIGFVPGGKVVFQNNSTTTAHGSTVWSSEVWITYAIDLRYSFNVGTTTLPDTAIGKALYIKCTLNPDDGLFYLATTWYAVDLPTESDDFYYIYIGQMYTRYQAYLHTEHPIYYYDSYLGKVVEYTPDTTASNIHVDHVRTDLIHVYSSTTMDAQHNDVDISAIVGQTWPHSESFIHINSSTENVTVGKALRKWTKFGEVSGATLSTANSITVPYNPYLNPVIPSPTSASEIMVTVEVQITPNYKTYEQWILPVDQLVGDENSPQHSMQQPNTILMGGFYYSSSYYGSYGVSYEREDFEASGVIFKWATDWAKVQGQGSIAGKAYRMTVYYR